MLQTHVYKQIMSCLFVAASWFLSVVCWNSSNQAGLNNFLCSVVPPGESSPGKSIRHMRQFHSHHNLLSLAQPSMSSASKLHGQDSDSQERRSTLGSTLSFALGVGGGSCSSLTGSTESSIWVRQTPQEESKPSPAANFWDFFTGKVSGSETMV